jgi:DNA-binding transcriptional MerR regulator
MALMRVGQLARRTGLTPKALRHYDRIGLLRPAYVDDSGHRWYGDEHVTRARRIAMLRAVDLPLEDVRRCLDPDDAIVAAVLEQHRRRLDARLTRVQRQAHSLHHLMTDGMEHRMSEDLTDERKLGIALFNATWTLMEKEDRTRAEDDTMLHMTHASRYHWGASNPPPENLARGEWQVSRVYAVLGRAEPCLHHAQRVLDLCQENGIGDWDLGFAYEALARAHAVAGDREQARAYTEQALAAAESIVEDGERELLLGDLETIPGQPRFW